MSTAKLAVWLHWQVTWVRFRASSSQPLADQPPESPGLRRKGGVGPSSAGLPEASLCPQVPITLRPRAPVPRTLRPVPPPLVGEPLMSAGLPLCHRSKTEMDAGPHAPCVGNVMGC